jgi:hypothetical protein
VSAQDPHATDGAPQDPPGAAAPGLEESLHLVAGAGKATLDSARDTGRALRQLVSADLALARSAFGRGLAWAGVAVVFGASSWLLLTGAIIALLQRAGLSWFQALFFTSLLSLGMTALAIWRVSHFFDHTGLHATRRQLSRLGLFDEHESDAAKAQPERTP